MTDHLHRAIIEQAHDAIIFADRDGIIRLWNRGAEIIFGFASAEALGRNLELIIPEQSRHGHRAGYRLAIETGRLRHEGRVLATRCRHKFGCLLYVDMSVGLVKDDSGAITGTCAIARDCTARQLEQEAFRELALAEAG